MAKFSPLDFLKTLTNSTKPPHFKFALFLKVYSYLWLVLSLLMTAGFVNAIVERKEVNALFGIVGLISVTFASFFFYKHTSKILYSYSVEEAPSFAYLKYINPVAPIIYVSTAFLVVIGVLNIIMGVVFMVGVLFYIMGILVTFGLVLIGDSYKMSNFTSVPKSFFTAEEYFFDNIISPAVFVILLIIIYFIIPFGTSALILIKHYSSRKVSL